MDKAAKGKSVAKKDDPKKGKTGKEEKRGRSAASGRDKKADK